GEDGELLLKLRGMHSCAKLIATMADRREGDPMCISSSKVAVYERHRKDLATLKRLVKRYRPKLYHEIFRGAAAGNYVAYSGNVKSCPEPEKVKGVGKVEFCDLLRKKLKGLEVRPEDREDYGDMMARLESYSFLPKQKDTDNRIIPHQLYRQELAALLRRAEGYLPMLSRRDEDGLTVTEKLLSIFDFRIPYYVGPLVRRQGSTAWIERKQGKILPWNFEAMVDLDASEQGFINRLVGSCTYLAGEKVLPEASLLYEKFVVLNELNNLKVDGREIPVAVKQGLFTDLFMERPRVTVRDIKKYLISHGCMGEGGALSGLDITFKSGLRSRCIFKQMLGKGLLTEEDVDYSLRQKLKGFGRLSRRLLTEIWGAENGSDGEAMTLIGAMWEQDRNLMQLLSDRYTFRDQIQAHNSAYYADHPRKLSDRLSEMYVSNGAKRPIFRALDIVSDVVKATGRAPTKIFVEMARGGSPDQKGKRTLSRTKQLLELYKKVKTEDAKRLAKALESMGASADSRLQDRKLYLYYLQLGKCAYTGDPIDLGRLADGTYNLEHIYPQSQVKDDSILNNLVLVKSEANGQKQDTYPVDKAVRDRMKPMWTMLKQNGLMTEEKYRRLTRPTPFTAEEKMGFIARQLVETRQSTKVISTLLKERFPETEIVYVKAGLVSEF
ncbi:MAG: type II CRISPR RNA-guided endonuclease Cas9, partial [Oscillospiraceae bacterium]|nr:type II CRISPR RNA-guided endonuclease Cas9 [Oscillospiraceae bacterium]